MWSWFSETQRIKMDRAEQRGMAGTSRVQYEYHWSEEDEEGDCNLYVSYLICTDN